MKSEVTPPQLSILVPVFNEQDALPTFLERLGRVLGPLDVPHEIVFIDDGSSDRTGDVLRAERARNPAIKIVTLSRNFGKEAALTAGFDLATGDAMIPIDADLQDPPEIIPELVRLWREGYEVVRARRADRREDTWLKRVTARLFYRAFRLLSRSPLPADTGDFGLFDRRAVAALRTLRESNRFLKGLYPWVGFRQTTIDFRRERRRAGRSKMGYLHLVSFALDAVTAFSSLPLRLWLHVGTLVSLAGLALFARLAIRAWCGVSCATVDLLLAAVVLLGGLQLAAIGWVGEYLGRAYVEVKQRPLYIVSRCEGIDAPAP